MTVTTAVVVLPRRMAIWAARRALARNSLTGIELGFSLCAAAWFSAGKPATALAGGAALGGGYLARRVGQVDPGERPPGTPRSPLRAERSIGPGGPPPWTPRSPLRAERSIGPGGPPPWTPRSPLRAERRLGEHPPAAGPASSALAPGSLDAVFSGWLAVICGWAGELAVYAGLAVGAAGSPVIAWKLATGTAMLIALRKMARLCRSAQAAADPLSRPPGTRPSAQPAQPPSPDRPGHPAPGTGRFSPGVLVGQVLAVPAWARALVITGTAAYYGNRKALLVMICCAAVALAWSLVAGPHRPRQRAAGRARAGDPGGTAAPGTPGQPGGVAACRDDGPIARFAGALVHGQLVPLPPAVAGLIATVLLAALGLGSLDGLVLLTPVAAMLLAAPGSAHPHDGPLDWLAPVIIQAGQYIYLAALGFAIGIPGPITFGLIGLVALRQLDVAYQAQSPLGPRGARGSLGWEGRMLVAGFSAMVGLGTVGYLALMIYLGWLLCGNGLSGWFVACRRIGRAQPSSAHPRNGGAIRASSG